MLFKSFGSWYKSYAESQHQVCKLDEEQCLVYFICDKTFLYSLSLSWNWGQYHTPKFFWTQQINNKLYTLTQFCFLENWPIHVESFTADRLFHVYRLWVWNWSYKSSKITDPRPKFFTASVMSEARFSLIKEPPPPEKPSSGLPPPPAYPPPPPAA